MEVYCIGVKKEEKFWILYYPFILRNHTVNIVNEILQKHKQEVLVSFGGKVIGYGEIPKIEIAVLKNKERGIYEITIDGKEFYMLDFINNFNYAFSKFKELVGNIIDISEKLWAYLEDHFFEEDFVFELFSKLSKYKNVYYIFYPNVLYYNTSSFEFGEGKAIVLIEK